MTRRVTPTTFRSPRLVDERDLVVTADRDWRLVVIAPVVGVYTAVEHEGLGGAEERFGHVGPGLHLISALRRALGPDNYRAARERGLILATSHPGWLTGPAHQMALWASRTFHDPDERRAWLGVYIALLDAEHAPRRAFSAHHWRMAERF